MERQDSWNGRRGETKGQEKLEEGRDERKRNCGGTNRHHLYGGATIDYFRARLFGCRLGLPCKNPLGRWICPHYQAVRMWTVCMINCLKLASNHADTGPLEPLMCRSQGRVPWGEWVNSTTDCNLKTTGSKQIRHYNILKTTDSTQVAITSHHPSLATSFILYSISTMECKKKIK